MVGVYVVFIWVLVGWMKMAWSGQKRGSKLFDGVREGSAR